MPDISREEIITGMIINGFVNMQNFDEFMLGLPCNISTSCLYSSCLKYNIITLKELQPYLKDSTLFEKNMHYLYIIFESGLDDLDLDNWFCEILQREFDNHEMQFYNLVDDLLVILEYISFDKCPHEKYNKTLQWFSNNVVTHKVIRCLNEASVWLELLYRMDCWEKLRLFKIITVLDIPFPNNDSIMEELCSIARDGYIRYDSNYHDLILFMASRGIVPGLDYRYDTYWIDDKIKDICSKVHQRFNSLKGRCIAAALRYKLELNILPEGFYMGYEDIISISNAGY
jgi:hypothetical protein